MARARDEVRVSSWNELQEALYEGSWKPSLGRFRSDLAFRGMGDAANGLRTSLMRLGGDLHAVEHHLLRNFRKYAHGEPAAGDSVWAWLALGQHHGLPTRLLDWTYSPLVAMHFATEDPDLAGVDGVIWCVDFVKVKQLLPAELRRRLDEEGSNVFTIEMLAGAAGSLRDLDALEREPFVLYFEPPSLDGRIVNQFALFSLVSSPSARLDEWLVKRPHLYRRVVIPADLKLEVRDKLDQANVTERVLYPGLDGLSRWLRRHYAPGPGCDRAPELIEAPRTRAAARTKGRAPAKRRVPANPLAPAKRRAPAKRPRLR